MNRRFFISGIAAAACTVLFAGCSHLRKTPITQQCGESVVCVGEEPASLAALPERGRPLNVRSTYLRSTNTIDYVAGRDYVVDYSRGTLCRTPGSRIPDYRTNSLYGQKAFDHSNFPGFGNGGFFAFVDYSFRSDSVWPIQEVQTQFLKATQAKLKSGSALKIVAFGDSITAGGDATKPELIFWNRYADELQRRYPNARISAKNGATGGDTTAQGLIRLKEKVLDANPDLVLVGFGMNDHNVAPHGVALPQFEQNLKDIIKRIRQATPAEIVLFSAFPPNPNWKFGSHHMSDYAAATEKVAHEAGCAYANVFRNWQAVAEKKKPEDLLGNNINHPNDFGHWIYYRVLCALGL